VYPGGEKTEGKEEAAETGRELYISDAYGRAFSPATREKHLIRSLSRHALLLPAPCHSWIFRSGFPPSNHISRPIPGSPCSLPVADKTSFAFPFQNFSSECPPSDPLQIQIYFVQRLVHPIPIFSFLTARSPLVKFYEICFPSRQPEQ
jgi:hypothetical protein